MCHEDVVACGFQVKTGFFCIEYLPCHRLGDVLVLYGSAFILDSKCRIAVGIIQFPVADIVDDEWLVALEVLCYRLKLLLGSRLVPCQYYSVCVFSAYVGRCRIVACADCCLQCLGFVVVEILVSLVVDVCVELIVLRHRCVSQNVEYCAHALTRLNSLALHLLYQLTVLIEFHGVVVGSHRAVVAPC